MMSDPSPRMVRQCVTCGEPFALRIDGGVLECEMWPDLYPNNVTTFGEQALITCPNCEDVVFTGDCRNLVDVEAWAYGGVYYDVKPATPPTHDKCLEFVDKLESGLSLSKTRRIQLRKWVWWTGNHPRRLDTPDLPLSKAERDNHRAMIEIVDLDTDENLITVVEIYRELGEFDAMRLYASEILGDAERKFAAKIIALSESHGRKFRSLS